MINVVIFGAPGSGKGTQSQLLIKKYGLTHVSTGDILRAEIKAGTELGKLADSYMSKGHLLPDEVVIEILDELIRRHSDAKGFIFDGFPRTLAQGAELDKMLSGNDTQISLVISLEVSDAELIDRLLKRGQISGRSDDNRETIESRLKVYYSQTSPLKEFYAKQGKLKIIEGVGTVEDIFKSIEKELDKEF
ncbi:MAG: adenylate kinase [Dysgonamonadaceae bacterium]|nr:adenylate kinase [Dysgonamonadaceae bacterium]